MIESARPFPTIKQQSSFDRRDVVRLAQRGSFGASLSWVTDAVHIDMDAH